MSNEDEFYDAVTGLDSDESYEGVSEASFKDALVSDSSSQKNNGSVPQENGIKKHRTSLPAPMFSRNTISIWSILRKCIGLELSKITMPIVFNEPLSFLQRITEYMEHTYLINRACSLSDSIERMQVRRLTHTHTHSQTLTDTHAHTHSHTLTHTLTHTLHTFPSSLPPLPLIQKSTISQSDKVSSIGWFKGIVHRKMKMHSLSTHHFADGGVGEGFESTKHFCLSVATEVTSSSDVIKQQKKNTTCLHTARVVSSKCLQAGTFRFDLKQSHLHRALTIKSTTGRGNASGRSNANVHPACALGTRVCLIFLCPRERERASEKDCMLCLFSFFFTYEEGFPFTLIVLDLTTTLFTPETPEVFRGLKHFTHPSIGIVAVAAFAVSAVASQWDRTGKPFNPLLGETYELTREEQGFRLVSEQVSHHPPVSAFHAESLAGDFVFHGSIYPKLKFWGKSVEAEPKGTITLELLKHNEAYTWSNPHCCVHNVVLGKLWLEQYGTVEIVNHRTGDKCVLNFKPCGMFGKELHKVEGYIQDKSKKKHCVIYGKWTECMWSVDPQAYETHKKSEKKGDNKKLKNEAQEGVENDDADDMPEVQETVCVVPGSTLLWRIDSRPAHSATMYNFTNFAMSLNELDPGMEAVLATTDCRFRPDIRAMENGNMDEASNEKERLEEKQRSARKERAKNEEEWSTQWFQLGTNPYTACQDWIYSGGYFSRNYQGLPNIY